MTWGEQEGLSGDGEPPLCLFCSVLLPLCSCIPWSFLSPFLSPNSPYQGEHSLLI